MSIDPLQPVLVGVEALYPVVTDKVYSRLYSEHGGINPTWRAKIHDMVILRMETKIKELEKELFEEMREKTKPPANVINV